MLASSKVATDLGCLKLIECKDGRCFYTCKLCNYFDQSPTFLNSSSILADLRKIEKVHCANVHMKLQLGQKPKKRQKVEHYDLTADDRKSFFQAAQEKEKAGCQLGTAYLKTN